MYSVRPLPHFNYRKQPNTYTTVRHNDFYVVKKCLKFNPHTKFFSGKVLFPSIIASFYLKVDSTNCKV